MYLWVKQKVGASVLDLDCHKLVLVPWREGGEQQPVCGASLKTQIYT